MYMWVFMCISLCSYNILHKNTKGNDHELNNVEDINSTTEKKKKERKRCSYLVFDNMEKLYTHKYINKIFILKLILLQKFKTISMTTRKMLEIIHEFY